VGEDIVFAADLLVDQVVLSLVAEDNMNLMWLENRTS
jgi:hypothetical protein